MEALLKITRIDDTFDNCNEYLEKEVEKAEKEVSGSRKVLRLDVYVL